MTNNIENREDVISAEQSRPDLFERLDWWEKEKKGVTGYSTFKWMLGRLPAELHQQFFSELNVTGTDHWFRENFPTVEQYRNALRKVLNIDQPQ